MCDISTGYKLNELYSAVEFDLVTMLNSYVGKPESVEVRESISADLKNIVNKYINQSTALELSDMIQDILTKDTNV